MSLYMSEDSSEFPEERLTRIIDSVIQEHMASLAWSARNFSVDTDEVQKKFLLRFKPMYETFLVKFQRKYYSTLGTDLTTLGAKGFISLSRQVLNYQANTPEEEPESGGWLYWLLMPLRLIQWLIVGIIIVISTVISFFAMIINFFGESPAVTARNILLEQNQAIYTTELPAKYWAEIEPHIKNALNIPQN